MAFLNVKNNASSKLAAAIDDDDLSLTVATGEGTRFPASNFHITIDDEILLCSSRTNDALTVTRAQESTGAAAHTRGANVRLNITAAIIEELQAHEGLTTGVHGVGALGFKVTSKVKIEERWLDAASGDVEYTGYGFQPTALVVFAVHHSNVVEISEGASDSAKAYGIIYQRVSAMSTGNYLILIQDTTAQNYQLAIPKSYDADGFTLTWTKGGAYAHEVLGFVVLALR